jgi:hypothetical protein
MAGSDEHIQPLRLFDLARQSGNQSTGKENEHLRTCEECQRIVEVFARQFDKKWIGQKNKPEDAA